MKPNDPHNWTIELYGPRMSSGQLHQIDFVGTVDDALAAADEQESEVDFDVVKFVIRRGAQANTGHEPRGGE